MGKKGKREKNHVGLMIINTTTMMSTMMMMITQSLFLLSSNFGFWHVFVESNLILVANIIVVSYISVLA